MKLPTVARPCAGLLLAWAALVRAAAPTTEPDLSAELPRIAPLDAVAARGSLRVAPGFRIDLAAGEELLASPVAIAWDADGRLFVVEMRGYSEHREEKLGRIRLLADVDDDGVYDRATVFADGLLWPTALCCHDGGLFVGDAPDILYLKDSDDDGVADVRRRVLTGFRDSNVQGLMNSFTFAFDNRIHGSAGSLGGSVRRVAADGSPEGDPVDIAGRDFSFDPRSFDVRAETGGLQHGMSFDDGGNAYVCGNSNHAVRCMIEDRLLGRNRFYAPPSAKVDIPVDGPQAEVFRLSPVEPWRVLRTRMRAAGLATGPIEHGGKSAGYFTSATGITVVRGDAFGPELAEMLVVGDVGSNLVHRKRVVPDGAGVRAERVDVASELVASTDNWFRPVQFANGPDGALWIIDMQREVIEHPRSIPPEIKRHVDLDSGRDRGRLWRLAPAGFVHRPTPKLSRAPTAELVGLLSHPNAWHRETAQRLLFERRDAAAVPALSRLAVDAAADPRGRRLAIHLLDGLGGLEPAQVEAALAATDPRLRISGVRLTERFAAAGEVAARFGDRLVAMAHDEPDASVRLHVALAAGWLDAARRGRILAEILARDAGDRWCRVAAFSSLDGDAGGVLAVLLADRRVHGVGGQEVLSGLATQVARRGDEAELARVLDAAGRIAGGDASDEARATATAMLVGLVRSGDSSGRKVDALLASPRGRAAVAELVRWNRGRAVAAGQPVAARMFAIRGLAIAPLAEVADVFAELLSGGQPPDVVREAVATLDRSRDDAVAATLVASWPRLTVEGRAEAGIALSRTPSRAQALFDAVAAGVVREADLNRSTINGLRDFPVAAVRERARSVFGELPVVRRAELVEAYRPCLGTTGDPAAGRELFARHCATCHQVGDVGRQIGPNLVSMQARGAEAILLGVLDPNREVQPQYVAHVAVTGDGRVITGVITSESPTSVTLRAADGTEATIGRDDIEELRSTGKSLMPEGFEKQIDIRGMGDLLSWLMTAK